MPALTTAGLAVWDVALSLYTGAPQCGILAA